MIDPATGASLVRADAPNGTYRVQQLTPTFSLAPLKGGAERPAVAGDILRFKRGADTGERSVCGRMPSQ